jgi:UDP-2,4-diacetamido-2,4,6-trideoxy-beta-L-altropyranose hydrolase
MAGKPKEIFFSAKGSSKIGFGHISRCLALIKSLPSTWQGALVLDQPDSLGTILNQHEVRVYSKSEIFELEHHNVKALIFDELEDDNDFFQMVRNKFRCQITALDYFNYEDPKVERIINLFNQNTKLRTPSKSVEYYEGLQFSIIASQFHQYHIADRPINKKVESLLIIMGGADPEAKTVAVIQNLVKWQVSLTIDIIVGPLCPHGEKIKKAIRELAGDVIIHRNPGNLPFLMAKADLAISGCSTTFFELSFVGTPAIILSQNTSEHRFCNYLEQQGVALYGENCIKDVWEKMQSRKIRKNFSRRQMELFDGEGSSRILKLAGVN